MPPQYANWDTYEHTYHQDPELRSQQKRYTTPPSHIENHYFVFSAIDYTMYNRYFWRHARESCAYDSYIHDLHRLIGNFDPLITNTND